MNKFYFLILCLILFTRCSTSYTSNTPLDNRNSKEVMRDKIVDGILNNEKNQYKKGQIEPKDKKEIKEEDNIVELKKILHLNTSQNKIFDLKYAEFNQEKRMLYQNLSIVDEDEKNEKVKNFKTKRDNAIRNVLDDIQKDIYSKYLINN